MSTPPCATRSSGGPTSSRREDDREATTSTSAIFRNQTLPDVTASFDYGLTALGGTQLRHADPRLSRSIPRSPTRPVASSASVLGDLFGLNSPELDGVAEHQLSARHEPGGSQPRPRAAAVQPGADAVRRTSSCRSRRRCATRRARCRPTSSAWRARARRAQLAERRLEAEQRKFQAGTSTSFLVFQAQRDLAQARNNELRAILDYDQSVVDFETVQEVPLARRRRRRGDDGPPRSRNVRRPSKDGPTAAR